MYIVIGGAGTLGLGAAEKLSKESHDIVLIDQDPEKLEQVANILDCKTVLGSAASMHSLIEAGIEQADMFLALTNDDHANIVAGMIAREYNVPVKIAKISSPEFHERNHVLQLSERLKIFDLMISPEKAAAQEIRRLFEMPLALDINYFAEDQGAIVGVHTDEHPDLIGKTIAELVQSNPEIGKKLKIAAIDRENDTIIVSDSSMKILPGDTIYVVGSRQDAIAFTQEEPEKKSTIMIVGASHLAFTIAEEMQSLYKVKIIDPDREKCEEIAYKLKKAVVLHGEGTDVNLLKSEHIENSMAFIALSNDEESNILMALLASNLGAERCFCLTRKQDYSKLANKLGIDATISPYTAALSAITRFVRKGQVENVISFKGNNAEVIEFVAAAGSPITQNAIRDIDLGEGVLIGGIIRGGQFEVATKSSRISGGDHVIMFTLPDKIKSVESLFSADS